MSLPGVVDVLIELTNGWQCTEENERKAKDNNWVIWLHPQEGLRATLAISGRIPSGNRGTCLEIKGVELGSEEYSEKKHDACEMGERACSTPFERGEIVGRELAENTASLRAQPSGLPKAAPFVRLGSEQN